MTQDKSIKKEIEEELAAKTEIELAIESAGGKRIMEVIKKGIIASLNEICSSYKTATHPELIAIVSKFKERFDIYQMFQGVKKAKEIALKDLEEILKEEETS